MALTAAADRAAAPTVLVLRALGLGDALTALPALRALRRAWPSYRLVLAGPPGPGALLAWTGAVDEVLPAVGLSPLPWPRLAPDVAVNLHGSGPQSHRLLLALRPGRLVGYACPELPGWPGPGWDPAEHEVHRWCRLAAWAGADADPLDLLLPPASVASPAPGAVVLHVGAAAPSRRWPPDRFAAVGAALATRGHRVVLTGTAAEHDLAVAVAAAAGLPPDAVLTDCPPGRLPLSGLVALLQQAALVVCGDTGVGHLATACGAPTVHLFGPSSPARWGPLVQPARHAVIWYGDGRGDPHGDRLDPALARIGVPDVLAAADALLHAVINPALR